MLSPKEIASSLASIPTLPISVSRVVALSNDEDSAAKDYEEALKPDPALTANILRLANSPFFGVSREIASVRQAVTLLGTKQLIDAAVGAAFSKVLPASLPGYGVESGVLWTHCIAVAVIAEKLAEQKEALGGEEAFTAGLLHDVGKLVTSEFLAKEETNLEVLLKEGRLLVDAEREILGTDHAAIGFAVGEKWNLSANVCAVIRDHHSMAGVDAHPLTDVVHVADCVAHSMGYGADVGELGREIDSEAAKRLRVKAAGLEMIVGESAAVIESMSSMFRERKGGN